jgi:hypothetical protein
MLLAGLLVTGCAHYRRIRFGPTVGASTSALT